MRGRQVVRVNGDDNRSVAQCYRIQVIPTLILFQNGEDKDRMIGVAIKEAIARTIDAHMGAASN
jgi:thioredoxin